MVGHHDRVDNGWRIRRARSTDGAELRRLRLEALQDAPQAFHEVFADAVRLDDTTWQNRAKTNAQSDVRAMFVAEDDATGHWLGMTGCYLDERDGPSVFAVYVTPAARGRGVSDALLDAVVQWARTAGCRTLSLGVHEENLAAQRLYQRHGFADTGRRVPYPNAGGGQELIMVRALQA
jgi:ribosomal protein S18 acetylase RimI-like enzyme